MILDKLATSLENMCSSFGFNSFLSKSLFKKYFDQVVDELILSDLLRNLFKLKD